MAPHPRPPQPHYTCTETANGASVTNGAPVDVEGGGKQTNTCGDDSNGGKFKIVIKQQIEVARQEPALKSILKKESLRLDGDHLDVRVHSSVVSSGCNIQQRRIGFEAPSFTTSAYEQAREVQMQNTNSEIHDQMVVAPPRPSFKPIHIPPACYTDPLLCLYQVVTQQPENARMHGVFLPQSSGLEYWHVTPYQFDAVYRNPILRASLLHRLHYPQLLKKLDKPLVRFLPAAVRLWYDEEKKMFYLASKLPRGSIDLASMAQQRVTVAHEKLMVLRKILRQRKFTGRYFGLRATTIFFSRRSGEFTLVDWSTYTTGYNDDWRVQHEKFSEVHGCMLPSNHTQNDFKYLVALADLYEASFFAERADFL